MRLALRRIIMVNFVVKRVDQSFFWPLFRQWRGYSNPYKREICEGCCGTGLNNRVHSIIRDLVEPTWPLSDVTQEKIDSYIERGWLEEFTSDYDYKSARYVKRNGSHIITVDEVNEIVKLIPRNASVRLICAAKRMKKCGVFSHCPQCCGKGAVWCDEKFDDLYYDWEPIEPPSGLGYQLWDMEHLWPVSKVFATRKDLAKHVIFDMAALDAKQVIKDNPYIVSEYINSSGE